MSESVEKTDSVSPESGASEPAATAPAADASPREQPARSNPGASVLAALTGDWRACRGAARSLANQGARVRILCTHQAEADAIRDGLREGTGALSGEQLALITFLPGRIESDSDLGNLLEGATGVAFLSPVGPEGRTWRAATHLEDIRSLLESVQNRRISRIIYLSSVNASLKPPIRCLREAAEAENLIEKAGGLDFLLRTGPVIGRGDSWVTGVVQKATRGSPFAVIRGYGDTLIQPIHEDDLGACVARCFLAPANDLHAGVYTLYSTPPTSVVDLLERTAKRLSRWSKVRLHIPLFIYLLGSKLRRLVDRNRAWESADRYGLLRCGLVAERNDLEVLMGPACSTRPLTNALEEALTALGIANT